MNIEEKKNLLIEVSNKYYNGLETGMDDRSYDALRKEVETEIPGFNLFNYLTLNGEDRTTVRHYYPYIDQAFKNQFSSQEEMEKIFDEYFNEKYVQTVKLDGCSISAYYSDGELLDILTRSDECYGKRKFNQLQSKVPAVVDRRIIKIDFEAVCSREDFNEDVRSNANGLINSCYKQDEVDKYIQLIPFRAYTKEPMGYIESMELAGFTVDKLPIFTKNDLSFDNRYYEYNGKHYPIDGFVFYDANNNLCNHKIFKHYSNQLISTTVRSINWNFTDKLCWVPKLEFDTVFIDGRNVSRCSSNGYARLNSIKAGVGSVVTIALVNSTIPQVDKVLKQSEDYQLIDTCPFCGSKMVIIGDKLRCSNNMCSGVYNGLLNAIINSIFNYVPRIEYSWNIKNENELIEFVNNSPEFINKLEEYKDKYFEMIARGLVLERYSEARIVLTIDKLKENYEKLVLNSGNYYDLFNDLPLTWNQSEVMKGYYDIIISIAKVLFKL